MDTSRTPVAQAVANQYDPVLADFRNFVYVLWKHLGLKEPTGIQYDIAQYLQHGPKRRIIQAFRGVGKSWITAAFVLWRLLRNPNERILVVSASEDRATGFTTFCRRLIMEVPMLQPLTPKRGSRDSSLAFDVAGSMPHQSPSLKAAGITGQITGSRASLIVPDDIEVPKNSMTQTMRDQIAELVKEFDAILMSPDDMQGLGLSSGEIVYLGTPQTEATIYRTLETRGYVTRIWPARFPDEKKQQLYGTRLAPMIREMLAADPTLATQCGGRGAPTEPRRFPDVDLLEREASYGRSGFELQFMLNPSLSDAERYPLKLADLIVMDCDRRMAPIKLVWASGPEQMAKDLPNVGLPGDRLYRPMWISKDNFVEYQGCVMAIDPAGRGGDELGYAIVAHLAGYLFVLRCKGLKGGYSDSNLELLAREAKAYGVKEIVVEPNFGDGMFNKLLAPVLQRIYPCSLTESERSNQQKERRIIDTLEPVMNQHRLVIDASVVREDVENTNEYADEVAQRYQLLYQMTRITRDKGSLTKDDRLDALALAVAYWMQHLDQDIADNERRHQEALMQQEIDRFLEMAGVTNDNHGVLDSFLTGTDG